MLLTIIASKMEKDELVVSNHDFIKILELLNLYLPSLELAGEEFQALYWQIVMKIV